MSAEYNSLLPGEEVATEAMANKRKFLSRLWMKRDGPVSVGDRDARKSTVEERKINKIKAFNSWANSPKGRDVFFNWMFWISFIVISILSLSVVHGQTVYGYANEGACINDIESGSLCGYNKTFSNELWLIAEGTHDFCRIAGNSEVVL